jgi:hypothetical protein
MKAKIVCILSLNESWTLYDKEKILLYEVDIELGGPSFRLRSNAEVKSWRNS